MEAINRQSRTSVHFSINYVIAIGWTPDKAVTVDFQKALLDNGLEFSQTNAGPRNFTLSRTQPSHLQVKLDSPAPQVSGIHIISAPPAYDLEMFTQEASAATAAYQQVYPAQQYQIIRCAAKIQHLYSSQEHAFQYLWETRLGQSPEDFRCLGRSGECFRRIERFEFGVEKRVGDVGFGDVTVVKQLCNQRGGADASGGIHTS